MMTEQTIYAEINSLPENLKQEVIDFVEFLKSKYKLKKVEKNSDRVFGKSKGKYVLSEGFDAPLDDFKEYM